ncbi:MAG: hypothetical protein B7Y05_04235 [Polynucleobacter sp. 24-46-87]|jgi:hypothetical protein|uniref:hypothetical protein n=1 Tax=unclassified Polynucleobacter TaxID=2640945 RepID=UPI000BC37293|nr:MULTISPECIES: hypothetical protein [unclassified Polynucleobacter]OYY08786.1 MAG: hypothetical protein B7Y67_16475 [Polynucleobacter sp. 35-46-11]OZA15343.1 MAG: hypothetical protein B7Y05_04235 [Polynucleobacter sp. 24-46-87]OZA77692.1 MAG: hypothetical protein B7X71_03975 [Polynucleobacter sp. 39-46-10]
MNKPNVYIRFLKLVEVLNSKSKIRSLDSIEKHLLNRIMLDDHAGQSILVGDLLKLHLIGSQATLHGRLKNLLSIGYIQLVSQDDGRKKRVIPTKQAHQIFGALSGCMSKAVQGQ